MFFIAFFLSFASAYRLRVYYGLSTHATRCDRSKLAYDVNLPNGLCSVFPPSAMVPPNGIPVAAKASFINIYNVMILFH